MEGTTATGEARMVYQQQQQQQQQQPQQAVPFQSSFAPYPSSSSLIPTATKVVKQNKDEESPSPWAWQRMKWTDNMIRLLIMIVYCVGDDCSTNIGSAAAVAAASEEEHQHQHQHQHQQQNKTTTSSSSSKKAMLLLQQQKKGKWKSVSRAMMEKGFSVSPQQCEDKFNDLNKRYKRMNELLGKGMGCRVVENPALLDSLDISPKAKEEARKLLNSKHLFFREMCAYHNGGGGVAGSSCASAAAPQVKKDHQMPVLHQTCHHPTANVDQVLVGASSSSRRLVSSGAAIKIKQAITEEKYDNGDEFDDENDHHHEDDEEEEQEDDDDDDFDDYDEDESEHKQDEEEEEEKELKMGKVLNSSLSVSPQHSLSQSSSQAPISTSMMKQQLKNDMASIGGEEQQRKWLKRKVVVLEEQRLGYQRKALLLERQRFKWLRFCSDKEREMERMKLRNQRLCLENERMMLLLLQKEQELVGDAASQSDYQRPDLKLMH